MQEPRLGSMSAEQACQWRELCLARGRRQEECRLEWCRLTRCRPMILIGESSGLSETSENCATNGRLCGSEGPMTEPAPVSPQCVSDPGAQLQAWFR